MRGKPYGQPAASAPQKPQSTPQQQPKPKPAQKPKPPQKPKTDGDNNPVKAENAVDGKDLSGSFKFDDSSKDYAIEQVIKAQGFDGKPTITNDPAAFAMACQASNFLAKRGVGASNQQLLDSYDAEFYVKCSGGSLHGYGMYSASVPANGAKAKSGVKDAQKTAASYAYGTASKVYTFTLESGAKIGTEKALASQMHNDTAFKSMCASSKMKSAYTMDVGVYAAYKGYDAYIAGKGRYDGHGGKSDYTVILNRSKVILYESDTF